ncbi:MAG: putative porin [Paludibacteraceae bacterium]|nr:putative porin [Paludibacteraceae bacterium]
MGKTVWLLLLLMPLAVSAKIRLPKTVVRAWSFTDEVQLPDSQKVDSSFLNFPMRNVQYDCSPLNHTNGSLVSPSQSALYFQRTQKTDFLFGNAYDIYTITSRDVRFCNTTTPYSNISYKRGFTTYHEEHDLGFDFTGNINKRLNLGTVMNYLDDAGHYKNQSGKTFNGSVFGSYDGKNYTLYGAFTFNQMSNFENGGLMNPADLQNKNMETEDMPVRLVGMSGYRYLSGYLNHHYSITAMTADSVEVPVMTFRHVFETSDATKRYIEKDTTQTFYENKYNEGRLGSDTAAALTINNTLSVTFEEAFNRHLRFGITAWARDEVQRHANIEPREKWSNNVFVGGAIHKKKGNYIRYQVDGEVCVLGRKLGEFAVNGKVGLGFKIGEDSLTVDARGFVRNETPDYFLQHYYSTHYKWDNDFKKLYRYRVGGEVAYPMRWFVPRLSVWYETVQNMIYFAGLGGPQQMDKAVSVVAADLTANITTPWVNLDNRVVYQYSSSSAVPLPSVTLYHNLYYHGSWFRKAMDAQLGVDLSYNTFYYAPYLNAALGQFAVQDEMQVGNYPRMNVYASFYVRLIHLRFFAQYQHFNASFMNRKYYSMPYYPTNPGVFRAGLAFHFYN